MLVGTRVFLTIPGFQGPFLWILVGKCSRWQQRAFPQPEQVGSVGCCDSHSALGCQKAPKCHSVLLTPFCRALLSCRVLEIGNFFHPFRGGCRDPEGDRGVELGCSERIPENSAPGFALGLGKVSLQSLLRKENPKSVEGLCELCNREKNPKNLQELLSD